MTWSYNKNGPGEQIQFISLPHLYDGENCLSII